MNTNTTPSNTDDVIDSRDIIARIEELQATRDLAKLCDNCGDAKDEHKDPEENTCGEFAPQGTGLDDDEELELAALQDLAQEASGYAADWDYGETLIRDSYFQTYAQELAEDCCETISDQWPHRCIDWEQAARELQMDYTQVDFDGVAYWIR